MDLVQHARLVRLSETLLPELDAIAPRDRGRALRRAANAAHDSVELVALAAGLVLVSWLTGYGIVALAPQERSEQVLVGGAIALPLIALVVALIERRRMRRGLRDAGMGGTDRHGRAGP
jgi:hypothetical protein